MHAVANLVQLDRHGTAPMRSTEWQAAVYHYTTLVSIVLSAAFLLAGPLRIYWLRSRRRLISDRYLTVPKQVSLGIYTACQLGLAVLWSRSLHVSVPQTTSAAAAGLAAGCGVLGLYLSLFEDVRSLCPSALIVSYLLLLVLSDLTRTCALWVVGGSNALNALLTATTALETVLFLLESVEAPASEKSKCNRQNEPETFSGIANRAIFLWPSRLFMIGARGRIEPKDLFDLDEDMTSARLHSKFTFHYQKFQSGQSCRALRTLTVVLWKPILLTVIPRRMMVGLNVTQPILTDRLLQYLSAAGVESPSSEGRGIIGAYTLQYLGLAVFTGLYWQCHVRVLAMIRGCLISALNDKILHTDSSGVGSPQASMTLMSTDMEQINLGFMRFHDLWGNALQAIIASYLLGRQVGSACAYPIVLVVCCAVMSVSISSWANTRQKAWMKAVETRVATTSSLISSIKGLKMRGLVPIACDRILDLRRSELKVANWYRLTIVYSFILAYIPTYIGPAVTFLAFILQAQARGEVFDASRAFTSLATLLILSQPLASTIQGIPLFAAAVGSCSRIDAFLATPNALDIREIPMNTKIPIEKTPSTSRPNPAHLEAVELQELETTKSNLPKTIFELTDAALGWNSEFSVLRNISTSIREGSLTCIVGPVACGKTTLCRALIGEGRLLSGKVQMFASPENVAYVDQIPWLVNESIQRNILGSSAFDAQWYDAVLEACGLRQDLEMMPAKSKTLVGNDGSALSGGQRQRVSLARAIYSRKSILVIDDVLSGLDARTARHVFNHAIGPAGIAAKQGATIIFASHSTPFLMQADHVIVLGHGGEIVQQGIYQDLNEDVTDQLGEMAEEGPLLSGQEAAHPELVRDQLSPQTALDAILDDKVTDDKSVYAYYFKSAGTMLLSFLLAVAAAQTGLGVGSTYWLSFWTEKDRPHNIRYWAVYLAMQVLTLVFLSVTIYSIIITMITRTGIKLHQNLINAVSSARLTHLSATDGGKTLNHFSQDVELIDKDLPFSFSNALISVLAFIGQAILIVAIFPWSAFIMLGCFVVVYLLQKVYLRTSRQVRLLDLEAKSPLYTNYMSIIRGAPTIRAYGWTRHNFDKIQSLLDRSQQPAYLLMIVQQWLNFVLEVIVACIAIVIVVIAVTIQSLPGNAGVVLTQVMSIGLMLQYATRAWTLFETSLGAISRIKHFEESTPSEARTASLQPPSNWPANGRVEMRNVTAAYKLEDTRNALKDISITVQPGEWIGICGKSGSGKSSFLQALLQLLEVRQGRIAIDGVCLDELEADVVRRRVTVIPQDPTTIPGTVRLNLDPYNQHSDDDIVLALSKVNLAHLIDTKLALSSTFNTENLSSGERQLFAIAMAILAKSKVVLVDEATSQVDAATEALVQDLLRSEFRCSTVFTIAHRLDGLMDYSRILVLDDGRVAEFDSPQALLGRRTRFREMFEARSQK